MTVAEALTRITEIRQLVATGYPPVVETSTASASGSAALAAALAGVTSTESSTSSSAFAQALAAVTGASGAAVSGAAVSGAGATASASAVAAPAATGSAGVSGSDIVEAAKKYLGVPYVFGGEDASGMDCSGLVQRVLADLGISAPRVVSQQQYIGTEVGSLAEAQPGDLLVTHNADHVVIYAGDGKIIHAPYPGRDVTLRDNYLTDADIQTIRRVVPEQVDATVAAASSSSVVGADLLAARLAVLGGGAL